jgi:hypothetical protein
VGLDRGHVIARSTDSANQIVHGEIKVHEGETFVVGRSFTKGSMDDSRLTKELERLSPFFDLEVDQAFNWVIIRNYGLPEGFNKKSTDILFNISGFPYIPPASIFGVYMETGLTYQERRVPNYYEALTRQMFGRSWAWFCTGHMSWDSGKDGLLTFLITLDMMLADPLNESSGEVNRDSGNS